MSVDCYQNAIDGTVGYARGAILGAPADEYRRGRHAAELIRTRTETCGAASIYNFTGHQCKFLITSNDLLDYTDETVGPALFVSRLERLGIAHMGGQPDDGVAVFNRTSAGIIATEVALASAGEVIVSVAPGPRSHHSVKRGATLARADLLEVSSLDELGEALSNTRGSLAVITGVTSELAIMSRDTFVEAIHMARHAGRMVLVDDAYGARIRPVLYDQPAAREVGADLVITSNQKAGLRGPRAGILVGRSGLVQAALAKAMEFGQEARGPLALGVMRALESYRPEHLQDDVEAGKRLSAALTERLGKARVSETTLGPLIKEDDILAIVLARVGSAKHRPAVVPAEAAAALGMLLLEHDGMLTLNAQGMPGARVSLRLKATKEEVDRFGGASAVARAIDECLDKLALIIGQADKVRDVILGPGS